MSSSMGRIIPYIMENEIHVWSHQPDNSTCQKNEVNFPWTRPRHARLVGKEKGIHWPHQCHGADLADPVVTWSTRDWWYHLPSGKHTKNYGKSQCLMDNSTTSMAIFNSYFDITRGYRNLQIPPGTPHPRRVGTPRHGGALQRRQLRAAGAAHGRRRRGRGVGGTRPNLVSRDWREHFFRIYPLVNIQKAIEHGHRNSWFTHSKWWIVPCFLYVYQRVNPMKQPLNRIKLPLNPMKLTLGYKS